MDDIRTHIYKNKFTGEFDRFGNPIFNSDACIISDGDNSFGGTGELQFHYLGNAMIKLISASGTLAHLNSFGNYNVKSIVDTTQQNDTERYKKNEHSYPRTLYMVCIIRRVPYEIIGFWRVTACWEKAYEFYNLPITETPEILAEAHCTADDASGLYKEIYKVYEFVNGTAPEHFDY